MKKFVCLFLIILSVNLGAVAKASVDSDFKERPVERFVIYTGDGNYKQAYHWMFNENGQGPAVTIFLNHGSGSEWYAEIDSEFGPCGPDHVGASGDFDESAYAGLCEVDEQGNEIYLADFNYDHVPVGPVLEEFMLKKIVGSTQFAAWYWQDAFVQFDSPVNIFMVGRYNVVKDPDHLDNALYWLALTDENTVSRDTLPPYNFDGYGLDGLEDDERPMHAAPDIAGFDNMFLYKAVREQYPLVDLTNVIVEGRSNGGSAMIAMASDYRIWPQHMRDFWTRNLPISEEQPAPQEPIVVPSVTLGDIVNNPILALAFEEMLSGISEEDLVSILNDGHEISLFAGGAQISGTAGVQVPEVAPVLNEGGEFVAENFRAQLSDFVHGDFYDSVKLAHAFYPGCRLDGLMERDANLQPGEIASDGDNAKGYAVSVLMMFSFGDEDSLYKSYCEDRVAEAAPQVLVPGALASSDIVTGDIAVIGEVFSPAKHGFDYNEVYKNLAGRTANEQARAGESRRAIERVVNQAIREFGLDGSYVLPYDLD